MNRNVIGTKFFAALLMLVILAVVFGLYPVFSALVSVTIRSSGTISVPQQQPLDSLKSEIRGVFLHMWPGHMTDMNAVLDTCLQNGINMIVVEAYPDVFLSSTGQLTHWNILDQMAQGCHARGLRIHVLLTIGLDPDASDAKDGGDRRVVLANGQTYDWLCFTKPASRSLMLGIAESLARDYNIDGFMYDYIRYESAGAAGLMCFCSYCKTKFIADTNLTDVNWPIDVNSTSGRYYLNFTEWRTKPVTELVRDMRERMLIYKPNMEFSAAVWEPFQDQETYRIMDIGQHVSEWVNKGYLDFVVPMIYTSQITGYDSITDVVTSSQKYYVGAREDWSDGTNSTPPPAPRKGAVRLPIFISQEYASGVSNFKQQVDTIRALGADGFIIWRYEGPGLYINAAYDIRPYLQALSLPPILSINNIIWNTSTNGTSLTIAWNTNSPATSKIEYSQSPLFNGTVKYGDQYGRMIHYIDVDYVGGVIMEDTALQTIHQMTIPVTPGVPTYFRIQSVSSGNQTATSKVYSTA
jgi:hypothetical protein